MELSEQDILRGALIDWVASLVLAVALPMIVCMVMV